MTVLERASPKAAEEMAPYLASARSAAQFWAEHAIGTGRAAIGMSEAHALLGTQKEIISWLAALGVLAPDFVDNGVQAALSLASEVLPLLPRQAQRYLSTVWACRFCGVEESAEQHHDQVRALRRRATAEAQEVLLGRVLEQLPCRSPPAS